MITRRPYSRSRDTPDNTGKTPDQKPKRLNNKLMACVRNDHLAKTCDPKEQAKAHPLIAA